MRKSVRMTHVLYYVIDQGQVYNVVMNFNTKLAKINSDMIYSVDRS
jgi:hypothetical protein